MNGAKVAKKSEADCHRFSIQELIQIILDEGKSNRLSSLFTPTSKREAQKSEKQRVKLQETISQVGFDSFVDTLVRKQLFLSQPVKDELAKQLRSRQTLSNDLRKKVT
jgi:hypothetical protein